MLDLLFEVFGSLIIEVLGEIVLAAKGALDQEETRPLPAVVFFLIVGGVIGAASAGVHPERVLQPGAFWGASLLVAPVILGAAMEWFGSARRSRRGVSHLATWYGGASAGFGLAAGRLAILELLANG